MTDERRFHLHVQAGTLVRIDADGAHVTPPTITVDGYCTTTAVLIPITIIIEP